VTVRDIQGDTEWETSQRLSTLPTKVYVLILINASAKRKTRHKTKIQDRLKRVLYIWSRSRCFFRVASLSQEEVETASGGIRRMNLETANANMHLPAAACDKDDPMRGTQAAPAVPGDAAGENA
jgi:hypothetical protein